MRTMWVLNIEVVLLLIPIAPVLTVTCQSGWSSTAYGCYKFITAITQPFAVAQAICQADGGDLARLQSKAEQDSLWALTPHQEYWIGLTYETDHFEWVTTGETLTWEAWDTGYPSSPGTNQCGALQATEKWQNLPCSLSTSYICEIDGEGSADPITTGITTQEIMTTQVTTPEVTTHKITTPQMTTEEITTQGPTTPHMTPPEMTTLGVTPPTPQHPVAIPQSATTGKVRSVLFSRNTYSDDVGTSAVEVSSAAMCAALCCQYHCLAFTFNDLNKKCLISAVPNSSMEFGAL